MVSIINIIVGLLGLALPWLTTNAPAVVAQIVQELITFLSGLTTAAPVDQEKHLNILLGHLQEFNKKS